MKKITIQNKLHFESEIPHPADAGLIMTTF